MQELGGAIADLPFYNVGSGYKTISWYDGRNQPSPGFPKLQNFDAQVIMSDLMCTTTSLYGRHVDGAMSCFNDGSVFWVHRRRLYTYLAAIGPSYSTANNGHIRGCFRAMDGN